MNLRSRKNKYKRRREDILSLRRQGLSYEEIKNTLGCSKSTISYHCGKKQTEKSRVKNQAENPLCKKVVRFKSRCTKDAWKSFASKVKCFKRRGRGRKGSAKNYWRVNVEKQYTCADVVEKIGNKPVCYLTGKKINLNKPSEYSLDHRIPTSKGGKNELDNLEICSYQANQAKSDLSLQEFYKLCEDVLAWRDKCKRRKNIRRFRKKKYMPS
jgi:predicted transcriptional regulator